MEKVGDGEKRGNWKEVSNMAAVLAGRPVAPSDPLEGSLQRPAQETGGRHARTLPRCAFLKTRAEVSLTSKGFVPGPLGVSRCEEFRGGRGQVGRAQIRHTHTHTLDQVV